MTITQLSFPELETRANYEIDRVNGPTNAQADLRLFGKSESDVRVTLYRDHHAFGLWTKKKSVSRLTRAK
ncbi:hypothetical protein [Floridanema evergladense]|uniref:Uncharacterized protein n=1 Tax=Floridaenema evergladense BLCC-F167 TaxID=3153639 RepID=A0ABV4WRP4_9CYAN